MTSLLYGISQINSPSMMSSQYLRPHCASATHWIQQPIRAQQLHPDWPLLSNWMCKNKWGIKYCDDIMCNQSNGHTDSECWLNKKENEMKQNKWGGDGGETWWKQNGGLTRLEPSEPMSVQEKQNKTDWRKEHWRTERTQTRNPKAWKSRPYR